MTSVLDYTYSPIKSNDIRLLKFLLSDEDSISATLQTFSLSPASQQPPAYKALSYVWSLGETEAAPARSWHVSIDGKQLYLLDSLKTFIQTLQIKEALLDNSWWWIDSICINQKDLLERSSQVALMQSIYSRAYITIVWLGESSANSDIAMDFIVDMGNTMKKLGFRTTERVLQDRKYSPKWEALESLFLRRWWTRVWTIQEFIVASHLSFWCGLKTLERTEVADTLQLFHNCRPHQALGEPAFENSWRRHRVYDWYKQYSTSGSAPYFRMSLAALASYCNANTATDKKDLLYGLSALTPDIQILKIDYNSTVEEAYTEFAKSHIQHYDSLDIICFAHLHCGSTTSLLPTWVPDWRTRLYHSFGVTPVMVTQSSSRSIGNLRSLHSVRRDNSAATYMASGDTKPRYEFRGLSLAVHGFVLDTIDGLGGSKSFEIDQPSEPHLELPDDMSSRWTFDILSSIVRCLSLGRRDRYLQDSVIPEEFVEDFQNFCIKAIQNRPSEVPTRFKDWFDHNRHFKIRGYPIESIINYSADNQNEILGNENRISVLDIQVINRFPARFFDAVVRICRRLMIGKNGILGMAPEKSRVGDLVCILYGCSVPVVLRKVGDGTQLVFIGECFMDGYMSGEAVSEDRFQETIFCIS
jgi:hypothetical protein